MTIEDIFKDKTIKAKAKVNTIGEWLLNGQLPLEELLNFAEKQKATDKATCIEALELATKKDASIANSDVLAFVTKALKDEEPRVKWESAKVISNIAKSFHTLLETTIKNLLINAEGHGTVVRWASATALTEILKLKTSYNTKLLPKIQELNSKEEDNAIKKKYIDALNKVNKK
jgi:hypothetical protein